MTRVKTVNLSISLPVWGEQESSTYVLPGGKEEFEYLSPQGE